MKAIVYEKYGPPDVLQLKEVETPTPKDNKVLVKIHAASVNARDWHLMRADPFLVRLMIGLLKPKNKMFGSDVAGWVEAAGRNVKQFQPDNEVFGDIGQYGNGAFAEYVSVPEDALALKPTGMTFEEAAAYLRGHSPPCRVFAIKERFSRGKKFLINGASGGVGTFALQIAKSFGAEVTGVCSTRNLDMARSLGTDQVIDYTQEDYTQNGQHYDLIIDIVGDPSVYMRFYKRSLTPKGICVIIAGSFFLQLFIGPWMSMTGSNKIVTYATIPNQKDLVSIKELLEAGKDVPVIDRRYRLSEVAEAIRYLEEGHARGKVVITVEQNSE